MLLGAFAMGLVGAAVGALTGALSARVPGWSAAPGPVRCPRPLLVGCGTAVLFVLATVRFGFTAALPAFLYLASVAVVLSVIDIDVHRLPDPLVLPSYPVAAGLLALASWGTARWEAWAGALGGGALLGGCYLALALVRPAGMGLGDAKLAGLLGLYLGWLGWGPLVVGTLGAFVLGGLAAVALLAAGLVTRTTGIPFGPFMVAGAALGIAPDGPFWELLSGRGP